MKPDTSETHAYGGLSASGLDVYAVSMCGARFPAVSPQAWALAPSCPDCRRKLGLQAESEGK